MPFVLTQFNVGNTVIYRIPIPVLIGAVLFALLAAYISTIKPCRYAARISAVEAVRYSGTNRDVEEVSKKTKKTTPMSMAVENIKRSRKKVALVVLSLSMILLNTTYTAVSGFDLEKYLSEYVIADFLVTDCTIQSYSPGDKNLSGVSENFLRELENLPGLENSASVYATDFVHLIAEPVLSKTDEMFHNGDTKAVDESVLEEMKRTNSTSAQLHGIDDLLTDKITVQMGEFDLAKWKTGKYVIVDDFFYRYDDQSPFYQIGDVVKLPDKNGNEQNYTVMCIGELDYRISIPYYLDCGLTMIVSKETYQNLYGDTQPLCTIFNINDSSMEDVEDWISDYCTNVEDNLAYTSRRTYEQEYKRDKTTYSVVGGVLAFILALIGLLNFINNIGTSIISRQKEIAMLRAIGLSLKQMKRMLIYESMAYIVLSFVLTATAGTGICYMICMNLISGMWAFVYRFTLLPVLLCLPVFIIIAIVVPLIFNQIIGQKSIVERLRQN